MASKLVSRTHFRRRPNEVDPTGWQWFWSTVSPNEKDTIGVGGEGYDQRVGALNGFFAQQGFPNFVNGLPLPSGYVQEKIDDSHYVISKYEDSQDNSGE